MITPLNLVYLGHNRTYILNQLIIIIITDIVNQLQVFCDECTMNVPLDCTILYELKHCKFKTHNSDGVFMLNLYFSTFQIAFVLKNTHRFRR